MRDGGFWVILAILGLFSACGEWESTGFQPTGSEHACLVNGFLFTARGHVRELGREWQEEEDVFHVMFLLPGAQALGSSWYGMADSLTLSLVRRDEDGRQVRSPALSLVKGEHLVAGAARYPLDEGNMFLARWEADGRLDVEPLRSMLREHVEITERVARFRALRPHDERLQSVTVPE